MKVSDLVRDILDEANRHFNLDKNHPNDALSVGMTYVVGDENFQSGWQVWLERPAEITLQTELEFDDQYTEPHYWQAKTYCFNYSSKNEDSLIEALTNLYDDVCELGYNL
jgi:hypothetical protein